MTKKGSTGFEPVTGRSVVECSTAELTTRLHYFTILLYLTLFYVNIAFSRCEQLDVENFEDKIKMDVRKKPCCFGFLSLLVCFRK